MLFIHILLVAINVFWLARASEYRRYNEIEVKLVSEGDETFETKMHEMLQLSERYLVTNKIIDGVINFESNNASLNEIIEQVGQILLSMNELISIDNDIIETLVSQIPIEIERANVRQDIVNMEAKIKTIIFNIHYLNGSTNIETVVQKSIVHDIHNDLFEMVSTLDHHHSGFKKHPLLAVPIVFSLASFASVYNRIETSLNPKLANRSIIGCKLQQVLREYQPIVTIDRLTNIRIVNLTPAHLHGSSKYHYLKVFF